MIRKILISSDGSASADQSVENAIELAKATGASVLGFAVTKPYPMAMYGDLMLRGIETVQHYDEEARQLSKRLLTRIEQAAETAGVRYAGYSVSSKSPAAAIIATAEKEGCDLICMALHDRYNVLGSHLDPEMTKVLTHARVPILVCH